MMKLKGHYPDIKFGKSWKMSEGSIGGGAVT